MDDISLSDVEDHLLRAMESLGTEQTQDFQKCAVVLRHALKAADRWSEAAHVSICNAGSEDPETARFYDALRQLIRDGLAEGQGDLVSPAGPRYTECRIAPQGRERLRAARRE